MPELLSPFFSESLPIFNRALILPINFMAASLVLMILNHQGLNDKKGRIFIIMAMFIMTWVDFAYLARRSGSISLDFAETLLRVAWVATPPVFFSAYWLSVTLVEKSVMFKKLTIILLVITAILSFLTAASDLIISGVEYSNENLDIVYGAGFLPFLLLIAILMFCTIFPLLKVKLSRSNISFLIGLLIFYIANLIFNISLPFFMGVTHLYYFGDYSTIFLLVFTTYAILRHGLFEIKVFTTEILSVVMWSVLFTQLVTAQTIGGMIMDGGVLIVMIVFGIMLIRSVRKEIEQRVQLESLTQKLTTLDKQKDEFLNVASHELRAPMTAVKGYLSMLQNGDGGEIPTEAREYLSEAIDETERMIRLINNMLDVSRIEEGRMVFERGVVKLSDVVRRVYNEFSYDANVKKLGYVFVPQPSINDRVVVDVDRIHEVVANLINNAIKYTDEGKVVVKLSNPSEGIVRFEVQDTGPGMTIEELSKLFSKFYRTESYVGKKIGTGLGLYISKLLVEKFGGKIGVESEKDKGSIFWFELPVNK